MSGKKLYGPHQVAHPAVFGDEILAAIAKMLTPLHRKIIDPFAGVGRIHDLQQYVQHDIFTYGVEIEEEWAKCRPGTFIGDATDMRAMFGDGFADAVVTSPCFGNRFADNFNPKDGSTRRGYRFDLGREVSENSAGKLQWGDQYREFHAEAWREITRVVRPGGRLILDISDHIRGGRRRYVAAWHVSILMVNGWNLADCEGVPTRRMGFGQNRENRTRGHMVLAFDKEET